MRIEYGQFELRISPGPTPDGEPLLPGSKSLINRCLACAALADGPSRLVGVTLSEDVQAMVGGLAALGVTVASEDRNRVLDGLGSTVGGAGVAESHPPVEKSSSAPAQPAVSTAPPALAVVGTGGRLLADEVEINVGHAGTAMRFLTALACVGYGQRRLDGSPRMRQRPIAPLVDALRGLGAAILYDDDEGFPPLRIAARGLTGGEVVFTSPPSSQFLSALLMVAPYASADVLIDTRGPIPSRPYVDMTVDVMRAMGVELLEESGRFIVPAPQRYRGSTQSIEPDASAACYFWGAAALTGGRVRVPGLSRASRQGDVGFVDVLARMGCAVAERADSLEVRGPADGRLRAISADLNDMPDTAQTLAVLALFADGPTEIRNVGNLRIKETDRISALARELTKLGANVVVGPDGLRICPPDSVRPAIIDTYDDHRMVMSFALVGLRVPGIVIRDPACVRKSFPGFFDALQRVCT